MSQKDWLWTEKYRPVRLADCIIPERIAETFQTFIDTKEMPNLILSGPPGTGKTSTACAVLEQMDVEWFKINAAMERGIDVVRSDIQNFASTMSFKDGRKYVILDEADGLTKEAQESLKAAIEKYASSCGFIFIVNNYNKLIEAIKSRTTTIDFNFTKDDFKTLGPRFDKALVQMLFKEKVEIMTGVLPRFIKSHFPDFRRVITELQTYAMKNNLIDVGLLGSVRSAGDIGKLSGLLKDKEWKTMRNWVAENPQITNDFNGMAKALYKNIEEKVKVQSLANFVLFYNDYDDKMSRVVDKEINVVAFLTQLMGDLDWS